MKSTKFIIFLFFLCISLTGCSRINSIFLTEYRAESKDVNFNIDKKILSTSYQNTSPRAEIINDRSENKILIYGGLTECSNVDVSRIKLEGSSLKIHLKIDKDTNSQLSVPQLTVTLADNISDLSSLNLEIIYDNYEPVKVNYNLNDIINKVKADFELYSPTSPDVKIINKEDKYLWIVSFENVFQKMNEEVPIINLDIYVDMQTGEIIKTNRTLVSSLIDYGDVLFHSYDNGFIYLNNVIDNSGNILTHNLYYYDLKLKTKKLILSTTTNITNAQMCSCSNNISFIDDQGNVYVYINKENRIKDIKELEGKSIDKLAWKNENELYLLDNSGESDSRIYIYNISEEKYSLYFHTNKNITNIKAYDESIIIEELLYPEKNNNIYLINESGELYYIDQGYKTSVINNDTLAYLKFDESKNTNSLCIYDLNKNSLISSLDKDFVYFTQTSDSNILAMENIGQSDFYQAYLIDLNNIVLTELGKVFGLKSFYDIEDDKIYMNSALPYDANSNPVIFSIKGSNLNK